MQSPACKGLSTRSSQDLCMVFAVLPVSFMPQMLSSARNVSAHAGVKVFLYAAPLVLLVDGRGKMRTGSGRLYDDLRGRMIVFD